MTVLPGSIDAVEALLEGQGYVGSRALATVVFLGLKLGKPLFLEGEAGVGKTEIAKVLAAGLGRKLIRLQCHEGLDAAAAVSEWNFAAQMIAIRAGEAAGRAGVFSEEFLIERPLLAAMRPQPGGAPVLLIDELDRADEPFEAFLRPGVPLTIACDKLMRIDFAAAGSVLNWAADLQSQGHVVHFQNLHRLIAVFFNVIGINEHAWVVPRKN